MIKNKIILFISIHIILCLIVHCKVCGQKCDNINVSTEASITNDTLILDMNIKNLDEDYYYFPVSEWIFVGNSKKCNVALIQQNYLFNSVVYYPDSCRGYSSLLDGPVDVVLDYKTDFIPKLIMLSPDDSIRLIIKRKVNQDEVLIDNFNYKFEIKLAYTNSESFGELIALLKNEIITETDNGETDLTLVPFLFYDTNDDPVTMKEIILNNRYRNTYLDYSNVRIYYNDIYMLRLAFLNKLYSTCVLMKR